MGSAEPEKATRLSSRDLAALIVDALVDAGFVQKQQFEEAASVATVEIDVRKALGDY